MADQVMDELFSLSTELAKLARVNVEIGETHIRLAVHDWIMKNFDGLGSSQIESLRHAIEPRAEQPKEGNSL